MNEKHLMIGNFVIGCYEDGDGKQRENICRIMAVDSTSSLGDGWWAIAERIEGDETEEYDDFKPILLTEEWLLKFGFAKEEITSHSDGRPPELEYCKGSLMMIRKDTGTTVVYWAAPFGYPININRTLYVHQLQNLYFALTGTELELK